ncbi:6734_t:CDS:2, partial [Acaulospora morrowiae]
QGKPKGIQIVELGPGRGTLLDDMLRAMSNFKECYETIDGVHLIEISPGMRRIQRLKLCGNAENVRKDNVEVVSRESDGLKFFWRDSIEEIPGRWSIIVSHEFFDAMPIHRFELKKNGWHEIIVDVDDSEDSPHHFRFESSTEPTSPVAFTNLPPPEKFKTGDRIEISPESWKISNQIAKYIHDNGGASLIIDYGKDFVQGDTLRAIKRHKFIHPLCSPGLADLSADVNFRDLKESAKGLVNTYGPITQSKFLQTLGIKTRLSMLLENAPPNRREILVSSYRRLIDPLSMGEIYKVLAFIPKGSTGVPVAFE